MVAGSRIDRVKRVDNFVTRRTMDAAAYVAALRAAVSDAIADTEYPSGGPVDEVQY